MATSPFRVNGLVDGQEDGARDAELISRCPPQEPEGMAQDKAWSSRYRVGYLATFAAGERHFCGPECER